MSHVSFPKPTRRVTLKRRRDRAERRVKRTVRGCCIDRDGACRLSNGDEALTGLVGPCSGPSEWAHFAASRRFKTRGQAPEQRHTTAGSLMLCARHHDDYDQRWVDIEELTARGADGPLRVGYCGQFYSEPLREVYA